MQELAYIQNRFFQINRQRQFLQKEIRKKTEERQKLLNNIETKVRALEYIQEVAVSQREETKGQIQKLITSCLREVYDESYGIQFLYGIKNNKTSVQINLVRKCSDGLVVRRGLEGIGGGVCDSISLPLKLVVLLNDISFDKVLIIDEPGKHLDVDRVPKFAKFLREISKRLGVQIIMSSHHQCMQEYADVVNYVGIKGSVSEVQRLK